MSSARLKNRYVITGVGALAPGCHSANDVRRVLLKGQPVLKKIETESFGRHYGGVIELSEEKNKKRFKRETTKQFLGRLVVEEALALAKIPLENIACRDDIICVNSSDGNDIFLLRKAQEAILSDNVLRNLPPGYLNNSLGNSIAGYISSYLKLSSPSFMLTGACASTNLSLQQTILNMDFYNYPIGILMGVSNESQCPLSLWGFKALRILNEDIANNSINGPLDRNRNGTVLSDGAGAFIIEELSHALERNADIIAEVVGTSSSHDPKGSLICSPKTIQDTMTKALKIGELHRSDIDLVNLHATGTFQGDINEVSAVREYFQQSRNTNFNTTKGHLGHSLAACGFIEIIGNLFSFVDGAIHPCAGINELDDECRLDGLVMNAGKMDNSLNYFLNLNIGMNGICTASIFKKWKHE